MSNPVVVIPARMAATRLPRKPVASIAGEPMIVHVWRRGMEVDLGPVLVATDDPLIKEAVEAVGGRAVLTSPAHPSGTDRIEEALGLTDPDRRHDIVVNIQGDLPTIETAAVRAAIVPLDDPAVDIATLAAVIHREDERTNPNVVKAIGTEIAPGRLRALYFTRATSPYGEGPLLHHIGLYVYRRAALERFVRLPPSPLEKRERLEQLRALEAGMRIDISVVETVPLGVDTQADLEQARAMLGEGTRR